MKYDLEKITRLLSEFKNARSLLKEIGAMDEAEFINDPHKVSSAKYNLIVVIESIIDICNHIISKNGLRVPEDYADTFKVMAENRLLPLEFTESLVKMARFRNRLVHLYWEVDRNVIFHILQKDVQDLDAFLKQLGKILS